MNKKIQHCLPQVRLNIKCALDPEIKLPIIILPASEVPADYGFEKCGHLNQASWNMAPQKPAVPDPVHLPPPYGAYAKYPSLPVPDKYSNAL